MNTKNNAWGKIIFETFEDDNEVMISTKSSMRQRTLSPRGRLLPESPVKKLKVSTASKVSPHINKQSYPTQVKMVATQTTFDIAATVTHDNFPVGSIVYINGYDLDYGKF